jgi:cytoskeletal protein CcmA (bactofilin family)
MDPNRATLIDAQAEFEGTLQGKDAHVLGRFKGDLLLVGKLLLGEGSRVQGRVEADEAEISGYFKGDLKARRVSLGEKAKVEGTLSARQLSVRDGAQIDGTVMIGEGVATPVPAAAAPALAAPPEAEAKGDQEAGEGTPDE